MACRSTSDLPGTADGSAGLLAAIRACRICRDEPFRGPPLPHDPRPILQASPSSRLCIASQAPGNRAHQSGIPFQDPSGIRLRDWLGLDEPTFYDASRVAIVPMGFCFPGYDANRGDLPPRRECAATWRARVFAALPRVSLVLAIGSYAQAWHLGSAHTNLTSTVRRWREILQGSAGESGAPRILPMPHPSWRNNGWIRKEPWFEAELLPVLRAEVRTLMAQ